MQEKILTVLLILAGFALLFGPSLRG